MGEIRIKVFYFLLIMM